MGEVSKVLRMRVLLADTYSPWSWNGQTWCCGGSVVEPISNPALCCHANSPHKLVVTEKRPGGDWLAVEIRPGQVRLNTGGLGTAPLYLTCTGESLYASWDVADLARFTFTGPDC
jgi:hypothetical protein